MRAYVIYRSFTIVIFLFTWAGFFLNCNIFLMKSSDGRCLFVNSTLSFVGTPIEQAECLLRPVKMYAHLGEKLASLPSPLDSLIGKRFDIKKSQLKEYFNSHNIREDDIGGSLSEPLSRANNNDPDAPYARYLIIHDTSTPNYLDEPFPPDINEKSWRFNDLSRWAQGEHSKAHVFINRIGESLTAVNFNTPWRSTKFEIRILKSKGKGLCLNIELIQPRRRDPIGSPENDAIAPEPGFTIPQLNRLALVYIAASFRRGEWLIPAYHAAIDAGIPNAHDDPQNFDLVLWANQLGKILNEIRTTTPNQEI
jgi:hypothetical protein